MRSLTKNGLSTAGHGLGSSSAAHTDDGSRQLNGKNGARNPGTYPTRLLERWSADTTARWTPTQPRNATAVVAELDVLLTGGRLNAYNKGIIEAEFEKRLDNGKCLCMFLFCGLCLIFDTYTFRARTTRRVHMPSVC